VFSRKLLINLPEGQSAFLWGPRKTGKSTYLKASFPDSTYIDFLKSDIYFDILKRPALLREQILALNEEWLKRPIILDEVQKIPEVLDEVHWMIENKELSFILCGSSVRKLKRGQANMLGGRAWRFEMHPLVYSEIPDFNLLQALNRGLIPSHYTSSHYKRSMRSYVQDYLKEEIQSEGVVRNLPSFARFLDAVGFTNGEMVNFSNIAKDVGVDSKTVREYFYILEDTLLGHFVEPWSKSTGRDSLTKVPKFYLFDCGVANYLSHRAIDIEKGKEFGHAFEHFIFLEILAYLSYHEIDTKIKYWRTKSGLEVDFIIGDVDLAIEVKSSSNVDSSSLKGMYAFIEEAKPKRSLVVCNEKEKRISNSIEFYPWRDFLDELSMHKFQF
jgi:predicted AAA+ superfamily ATPase